MGHSQPRDEPHARGVHEALQRGRADYAAQRWVSAYEAFSCADAADPLARPDLEQLAWSAALSGRDREMLKLLERLYHAQLAATEQLPAARSAFWLGMRLSALGDLGRASGWLARAQRLVAGAGSECVEQGYLLLPVVHRQLAAGEHDAACATAAEAATIGLRFGETDLIALARNLNGRALLKRGDVERGLALLDEAMLAVTAGELSPLVTGLIYCNTIAGCHQVYALERAREWTSALSDWCAERPELLTFAGTCLVHRAEIMQLGGDWREAIETAQAVSHPEARADGLYQQAEIHRLRGQLAQAERAYRSASEHGREPQPGLALLRLAQGRVDAAAAAIRRVLGTTSDRLKRVCFLPACLEIMLAAGSPDEARAACLELEEVAACYGTDVLGALAGHARGALLLSEGDAQAALRPLREAFVVWQRVGAPYLAARLRVTLARANRALGDQDGCALELEAARAVFERLGATPDVARIDAERAGGAGRAHGLSARELQVLKLVAAGKTNKAIASELHLSEKTVDRHLSNIFTKLDVASRTAATAYAYERGLV